MTNVVRLPCITRLDTTASVPLEAALEEDLKHAIVIGETSDGDLYFASSLASGPDVLWELERAKVALLRIGGAIDE